MDFVRSYFSTSELLTSWTLFFLTFWPVHCTEVTLIIHSKPDINWQKVTVCTVSTFSFQITFLVTIDIFLRFRRRHSSKKWRREEGKKKINYFIKKRSHLLYFYGAILFPEMGFLKFWGEKGELVHNVLKLCMK